MESRLVLSTLSVQDHGASENFSPLVSVKLSEASTQPVTVHFTTVDGTAKAPQDYKATAGTLTFQPGETTKSVLVGFQLDNKVEPTEYLFVHLSNPTNATIADGQATVFIYDAPHSPPGGGSGRDHCRHSSRQCLTAAASAPSAVSETLTDQEVQPLLTEALARWQAAGVDISNLGNIRVQITNLGSTTLGLAAGRTIWLDDNAAGWGWFVDKTPWDDSEFTTPGNQGEQHRMDLLTVLEHEIGHLLGYEHEESGVMMEAMPAGVRRNTVPNSGTDWVSLIDALFGYSSSAKSKGGNGRLCHEGEEARSPILNPRRPQAIFEDTSFWAQGFLFDIEFRF